jgi:hypothetical protein
MNRSYFDCSLAELPQLSDREIVGALTMAHGHALDLLQRDAWLGQIANLRTAVRDLAEGHLFVEFAIPRMGKRADAVLLLPGLIVVLEYKVGSRTYERHAIEQVVDYALDLKNFHEGSHQLPIVPVLVATEAVGRPLALVWHEDDVAEPVCTNATQLPEILAGLPTKGPQRMSATAWATSRYKPTPTIVEAATALYEGHGVADISRSDAGAFNLSRTAERIESIIERAKHKRLKAICFVTGVPGSGKTLAGLNVATRRRRSHEDEQAVFLSGNGPLVAVLREALARDEVGRSKDIGQPTTKKRAHQKASVFIQNVHHFRDECLTSGGAPVEGVVVFDEAQRAWDQDRTSQFMRERKGIPNFDQSEPAFLLSAMDRHPDWCVVICLIGNGQEINRGEAGMEEWFAALDRHPDWEVYRSPRVDAPRVEAQVVRETTEDALHLGVSIRSFRSERVAEFVHAVISGDADRAASVATSLGDYPIVVTRNLGEARTWLRKQARGSERYGLVASSNGLRLKPHGLHMKAKVDAANWFLGDLADVRSSMALEDAASEFEVQGLELDWAGVCWDANLRYETGCWGHYKFSGSRWKSVRSESGRTYLENAYRVLLTRARQGMVVFVPHGDPHDSTRAAAFYDPTYDFLIRCGLREI